jgi:hypothetical protein
MSSTRATKKNIDSVLEYVGIGDYIYSGAVNRRWRGRYIELCYNSTEQDNPNKLFTLFRSVLAIMTEARLQLALASKLELEGSDLATHIKQLSLQHISVLKLAKLHNLQWHDCYTKSSCSYM